MSNQGQARAWWVCWVCLEKVSEAEYFTARDGVTRIIHDWCIADAKKQDRVAEEK